MDILKSIDVITRHNEWNSYRMKLSNLVVQSQNLKFSEIGLARAFSVKKKGKVFRIYLPCPWLPPTFPHFLKCKFVRTSVTRLTSANRLLSILRRGHRRRHRRAHNDHEFLHRIVKSRHDFQGFAVPRMALYRQRFFKSATWRGSLTYLFLFLFLLQTAHFDKNNIVKDESIYISLKNCDIISKQHFSYR